MNIRCKLLALCCAVSLLFSACAPAASSASTSVAGAAPSPSVASAASKADLAAGLEPVLVTDLEGAQRDLAQTPWAQKYPSILAPYREDASLAKDITFPTMAQENITPKGSVLTVPFFGTEDEQPLDIAVQDVVKGAAPSLLSADQIAKAEAYMGRPQAGQAYLEVRLSIQNQSAAPCSFYLNSISLRCCVDGAVARGNIGTEAVGSDLPFVADDAKNSFETSLEPGETGTYCILYYVNADILPEDLYLCPNFLGAVEMPTSADYVLNEEWLALA